MLVNVFYMGKICNKMKKYSEVYIISGSSAKLSVLLINYKARECKSQVSWEPETQNICQKPIRTLSI